MSRRPSYFDENYDELMEERNRKSLKNLFTNKFGIVDIIEKAKEKAVEHIDYESEPDLPEAPETAPPELPQMPDLDKIIADFDVKNEAEIQRRNRQDKPIEKANAKKALSAKEILLVVFLTLSGITKKLVKGIRSVAKQRPISHLINGKNKWIVNLSLFIVTVLIFTGMVGIVISSVNRQNAKIQKFDTDAGIVCSDYIKKYGACSYENLYQSYGVTGYRMTGLSYLRELDFDGDGTSELMLCYNDAGTYYLEVWGYVDGEFVNIYHGKITQTKNKADDNWITLYYHNGKYLIGVHGKKDISKVSLYAMKGDGFEKKSTCTYDIATESFVVKNKVNYTDFERIKLAVLREEKANIVQNHVLEILDDFSSVSGEKIATESKSSVNDAYLKIIRNYQQKYGVADYKTQGLVGYADGLASVKLVNFDGKGKNELMLIYRKSIMTRDEDSNGNYIAIAEDKYFCDIYTYAGGVAKLVYQTEGLSKKQNNDTDVYALIQKDGKKNYFCSNTYSVEQYGHVVTGTSNILEFDGTSFVSKQKSRFETSYGYSKYYINDKSVYRTEFVEKGYTVPFFDGTESFDANNFEVIYLQSGTKNADKIENQIDATNSTISSLSR